MGKAILSIIMLSLILIPFSYAAVYVNEVELNPQGNDAGNEWVEIYSDEAKNMSGWYIKNSGGDKFYFPNITIEVNNFYVLDNLDGLDNSDENISLYNEFNFLQDELTLLEDNDNNDNSWQRDPDGGSNLSFKDNTKGLSNEIVVIIQDNSFQCLIKGDVINLNANVSGFCIDEVIFSLTNNGDNYNYSANEDNGNYFISIINKNLSGIVQWNVFSGSCINQSVKSSDEYFYINEKTVLNVNPNSPNGENGWYITEPIFSLSNSDASNMYYKWNGDEPILYSGPFNLDNAPNDGNITGGVHSLRYFGDFTCKNESLNNKTFYFDFTDPKISDIFPKENSIIGNAKPTISAYIDEIYQSNSEINISSIVLKLDSIVVGHSVDKKGIDANISYQVATDLSEGEHEVELYVMDLSGRETDYSWEFIVDLSSFNLLMNISSPIDNGLYNDKRVLFNISLSDDVQSLEFINFNSKFPRWKTLCRNCDEYGFDRKKTQTMEEGMNELMFMASGEFGDKAYSNMTIFVDSKEPRVRRVDPGRGFSNGSFIINYFEENPTHLLIHYGNNSKKEVHEVNLSNCYEDRRDMVCNEQVDLSDFQGQDISYYVNITDIVGGNDASRVNQLSVDVFAPMINSIEMNQLGRRVEFIFNVTEENFDEIVYIDNMDDRPRERRLCSRLDENGMCQSRKSFRRGGHNLSIIARDDAGNVDVLNGISFSVQ